MTVLHLSQQKLNLSVVIKYELNIFIREWPDKNNIPRCKVNNEWLNLTIDLYAGKYAKISTLLLTNSNHFCCETEMKQKQLH